MNKFWEWMKEHPHYDMYGVFSLYGKKQLSSTMLIGYMIEYLSDKGVFDCSIECDMSTSRNESIDDYYDRLKQKIEDNK